MAERIENLVMQVSVQDKASKNIEKVTKSLEKYSAVSKSIKGAANVGAIKVSRADTKKLESDAKKSAIRIAEAQSKATIKLATEDEKRKIHIQEATSKAAIASALDKEKFDRKLTMESVKRETDAIKNKQALDKQTAVLREKAEIKRADVEQANIRKDLEYERKKNDQLQRDASRASLQAAEARRKETQDMIRRKSQEAFYERRIADQNASYEKKQADKLDFYRMRRSDKLSDEQRRNANREAERQRRLAEKTAKEEQEAEAKARSMRLSPSGIPQGIKAVGNISAKGLKLLEGTLQRVVRLASKLGSTIANTYRQFTGLGKVVSSRLLSPIKNLMRQIGRIAFYRAIRTVIKDITQGFSEGTKALYDWSQANGEVFSTRLDQYATSMQYLRNSFAVMFAPLEKFLIPILDKVVDKVVDVFNTVQQLFAVLTGQDYWYKVIKKETTFGEMVDKSNKSLKKQIQLMNWDEINNITTKDDNGVDVEGLFDTVEIQVAKFNIVERIKEAIKNGDWKGVGQIFAEGIDDAISNLKEKSIGKKIASVLNGSVKFLDGLLDFNANGLGNALGTQIADALNGIEWGDVGNLVGKFINKSTEFTIGLFKSITWRDVGNNIGDFIGNTINTIDTGRIATKMTTILSSFGNLFMGIFERVPWGEVSRKVLGFINTMLNSLNFGNIGSNFATIINTLLTTLKSIMINVDWVKFRENVSTLIANAVNKINWNDVGYTFAKFINTIVDTLIDIFSKVDLWQIIKDTLAGVAQANREHYYQTFGLTPPGGSAATVVSKPTPNVSKENQSLYEQYKNMGIFASGGYPTQGSLFLAGEVPGQTELLGSINGRTGVVGGAEITGISDAVYTTAEANNALLRQLISVVNSKNLVISPSANLGRVVSQSSRMYQTVTG